MKGKVKLDVASIKSWLFAHGEKVVLGLVGIIFLLFTYSALTREALDDTKQPDRLLSKASEVQNHLAAAGWDPKSQELPSVDFQQRAKREKLNLTHYALKTPLNMPLRNPKEKRGVPKILPAEDIRIASGYGIFGFKDAAAAAGGDAAARPAPKNEARGNFGARPAPTNTKAYRPTNSAQLKGQPWAVITGLVPVVKQEQLFAEVFQRAMNYKPEEDVPIYGEPILERTEIDLSNPDKVDWKPVARSVSYEAKWEARSEIVAPAYVHAELTRPLGPLVGEWGESVSHPKVQLAAAKDQQTTNQPRAAEAPAKTVSDAEFTGFNEPPPGTGASTSATSPAAGASTTSTPAAPSVVEHRLLRIFDYSAEPNKTYRYRFMLRLRNPNYNKHVRFLQNPESTKSRALTSEWIETDAVTIPDGAGVLAGGVVQKGADQVARLLLYSIDKAEGIKVPYEIELGRGAIANRVVSSALAWNPATNDGMELGEVNIRTDMTVLDMYGGKPLGRARDALVSPGEVLLMDARGNLRVQGELEDYTQYEFEKPPVATVAPKKERVLLDDKDRDRKNRPASNRK